MNNTKQQGKLLPAAMMSLALVNSPMSTAIASIATADVGQAMNTRLPVVMQFEPDTRTSEPAVLIEYVKLMSDKTGYIALMPEGRCGTISGSGNGWDDSKFDC